MDTRTVAELVRQTRQGNEEAFSELVRRHKTAVHGLVLSRLRDTYWAEDLVQETFAAAFLGIRSLRNSERFVPWIFGIAENLCASFLRHAGRSEEAMRGCARDSGSGNPQVTGGNEITGETALAALSRLPPDEAVAFALRYGDGLKVRECAELVGTSVKAMESRIYRARQHVRKEVGVMEGNDLDVRALGEAFDQAVRAEIRELVAIVGGPYKKKPVEAAEDRLKVLFARNEDRLCDLIRNASDGNELRAAARMTLALGKPGITRALSLVHSGDETTRLMALAALPLALDETHPYLLLEAIHDAGFSDATKAETLVALLRRPALLKGTLTGAETRRMAEDATVLMEMLVQYGDMALRPLAAGVLSSLERDGRPDLLLLRAMARFGTSAIEKTSEWLGSSDDGAKTAGLLLVEMIGAGAELQREKELNVGGREITESELLLLARGTSLAATHVSRINSDVMEQIAGSVCRLTESESREVSLAALQALRTLPDAYTLPAAERAAFGEDAGKAESGTKALFFPLSLARLDLLVRILEKGHPSARKTAFRGIQRHAMASQDILMPAIARADSDEVSARAASDHATALTIARFIDDRRGRILEVAWPVLAPRKDFADFQRQMGPWAWSPEERQRMQNARASHLKKMASNYSPEFQARADDYRRTHPDFQPRHSGPHLFHASMPALVRELERDRVYSEKEITAAAVRTNSDHCLARRKLIDEWWMTRGSSGYAFTERGRRAWRMERFLAGKTVP